MAFPGLNFKLGKVVEDEVQRKFGVPVCHDPSLSSPEIFLVLSFRCCRFCLTEVSASLILQSVIGGDDASFRLHTLGDRVFWSRSRRQPWVFIFTSFACLSVLNLKFFSTFGTMAAQIISLRSVVGRKKPPHAV
jgi:hypothetical protein